MKRIIVIAAVAVLGIAAVILLIIFNKKDVMYGGVNSNFPYTWQEKSNGSVVVKLNGSFAPQHSWVAENSDPTVVTVERSGEEKNGEVTFVIAPTAAGTAGVTFSRSREIVLKGLSSENAGTGDISQTDNAEDTSGEGSTEGKRDPEPGDTDADDVVKGDVPPEPIPIEIETAPGGIDISESSIDTDTGDVSDGNGMSNGSSSKAPDTGTNGKDNAANGNATDNGSETNSAGNAPTVTETIEIYDPNETLKTVFSPNDTVCEITILFNVESNEKNGKLAAKVNTSFEKEYDGIYRSTDETVDYKLWVDQDGRLLARIPFVGESWEVTWDGEYYEPVATEAQPDRLILVPEFEDGRYIIISVRRIDAIDGDECFMVEGLGPGQATITFSNGIINRKVILKIRISDEGSVTLLYHETTRE